MSYADLGGSRLQRGYSDLLGTPQRGGPYARSVARTTESQRRLSCIMDFLTSGLRCQGGSGLGWGEFRDRSVNRPEHRREGESLAGSASMLPRPGGEIDRACRNTVSVRDRSPRGRETAARSQVRRAVAAAGLGEEAGAPAERGIGPDPLLTGRPKSLRPARLEPKSPTRRLSRCFHDLAFRKADSIKRSGLLRRYDWLMITQPTREA